jgi:glutamate/tyrosine decarboxylase-like PLP-dependent enzyme
MEPRTFRRLGHELVDRIADHLERLPETPVTPAESPAEIRTLIDAGRGLPERGSDAGSLISEAAKLLFEHSLFNGHPRFFGYVTASAAPIGVLADLLAAAVNPNVGAWKLSPMATEIEAQTVRWIAELIGFPADCGGLMTSGGNAANFVGFLSARAARARWDVRRSGAGGPKSLRCYVSTQTHTWVQKAADLFGLGTDSIRWVPTDPNQRMDVKALRRHVAEDFDQDHQPFLVVGTAGTVSTGAVDPLPEIAAFCRESGLWFHVDGAYGGIAACAPGVPADLLGLTAADSVAVDPHKWLYAPLEAGCALVRDAKTLLNAFSYHPPYYHFDPDVTNYFDLGPQNSRGFRALKVWLALRQAGREGYRTMVADDISLAQHLYRLVEAHPDLEAVTQSLSITTFRYVPGDLRLTRDTEEAQAFLNRLNQEVLTRIEKSGEAFLSNAVIDDKFCLRLCIVNFRTTTADVEALPELVIRHGRQAYRDLNSARAVLQAGDLS